MYKIFTLAIAVAVLPISQQVSRVDHSTTAPTSFPGLFGNYKAPGSSNIFGPEEKTGEAWSQNWMATAQENIRKSEYHFKWNEKTNSYSTPNRENNLRFFYDDKGFSVEPRSTYIPVGELDPASMPGEIKYRRVANWKVRFNLDHKNLGNGSWKASGNLAEYATEKITVQYLNNEQGMRQNFIVHQPVTRKDELQINFSIQTKLKTRLAGNQLRFFHKKTNVLNYQDLQVWDATGKPLEASLRQHKKNKFYIQVNTKGAVYPITVDPLSTTPSATLECNQAGAFFGYAIASAGDVNGDGYSDVIAGAYMYDNGEASEGAAFIYHGSSSGINSTAAITIESNQENAHLGNSVSTAGDVNADGYSDVIIGSESYSNGEAGEGVAFVYHGSPGGIGIVPATVVQSNQAGAEFGVAVACAGDVNADGYSDIVVGAYQYDNGQNNEGAAFIFHGSSTGVNNTAAAMVEANQDNGFIGTSAASAGDVNGDGYSDIIIGGYGYDNGQTDEGAAFIYHGSSTGINTVVATIVESNQANANFGYTSGSAGDVNGDGYSDVIVGAYLYDNGQTNEGAAFIYHGSSTGINPTGVLTLERNQANARFGAAVSCAGDVNGDGYADVIVGALLYSNPEANEGAVWVFPGSATGISATFMTIIESNQGGASFGIAVAGAGDVNGDGYSDVIVGAYAFDNGQTDEGAAFVYHGSAAGISTTANTLVEANQASAQFGYAVSSAGDVNADGFTDVVIASNVYDNGQTDEGAIFVYHGSANGLIATPATTIESNQANSYLGISVACAGDVNGDGYSDIIAGAHWYDNGQTDEGVAFVYHGSAAGINATAAALLQSNQASSQMGFTAASAGDVNGDGYSDVIVGARWYSNVQSNEGVAFIYHGSATGINTTAAAMVESNQVSAQFGYSVSSAGDVNGDGFSDVLVGSWLYDNGQSDEGAVFVYHGSATGINTSPMIRLERNQAGAYLGWSVACAGDINGDGYSDAIISAWAYDNVETDEGAAFIYHGSASGISALATTLEANQASARFGTSVAGAGDINGDGFADVVVGAYEYDNGLSNEGAVFVYHGSSTGINATAAATMEVNQGSANLGCSVAAAGDVNGDGYSDLVVGAYGYDNGQINEGTAYVYQGNSPGTNKRNNLRLYNTNLTTPINRTNYVFGNFGAGLYAKSFAGRAKGKLVWETRLNYNAYSGTPITNSTFFTAQQSTYTDLGLNGIELKSLISKINGGRFTKLRARIKYDPVTAITGQVYSPWRNVSSIIDANNLGVLPIELISFQAAWIQKGKTARLEFTTDKESGICCFDIEKSSDGFNFFPIGTLPAKNAGGIQSYSFIDNNAVANKQFYRLKIKGIAGQVEYSNIQQLQNSGATEILVFPNPTADMLQLQLNGSLSMLNIRILNSAGQLVKQLDLPASNSTVSVPVQNLAPGKYWLQLQGGDQKQVLQFVKQ